MIDEKLTDRRSPQRTIKPNHVAGKLNLTGRVTEPSRTLNKPPLSVSTAQIQSPTYSNSCPADAHHDNDGDEHDHHYYHDDIGDRCAGECYWALGHALLRKPDGKPH